METKANTALIGAFTLLVLALGFGFIYWLARADRGVETEPLQVVFTGPVSGLSSGSPVMFNGIRVGEVRRLGIDPQDPRQVIADLKVDAATPVKTDTSASVGFQGLTGVAYVELIGGSPGAPSVWEAAEGEVAVLVGERSAVQDLMSGARQLMGRADETLTAIRGLVRENSAAVNRSVDNLERFSSALAQNSDRIATFVQSVSEAADGISRLSGRLEQVVARGEALIAAVEPDQVRQTLDNVTAFSDTLADSRDDIDRLVTRFSAIAGDVNAFTARLDTIGDKTDLLITDLRDRTGELMEALQPDAIRRTVANLDRITAAVEPETVQRAIGNIDRVTGAVDPEAVSSAVANISGFSETLSARRADINALVTRLSTISADVSGFTADLPALRERVDAVAAAVDPEKVGRAVDNIDRITGAVQPERVERAIANIDRVTGAVDPEAVRNAVANISGFSETLSARRADIDTLVTRLSTISGDVSGFTADLPALRERIDAVAAAVDPEKVGRAVDSIEQVAGAVDPEAVRTAVANISGLSETLSARRADIDALVTRLSTISADVSGFTADLPALRERVDAVAAAVDPQKVARAVDNIDRVAAAVPPEAVESAVSNISQVAETLAARRQDIDVLVTRLSTISADVRNFTGGLPALRKRVDAVAAAVDPDKVARAVDNVDRVAAAVPPETVESAVTNISQLAETLAARRQDIDGLVTRMSAISADVSGFTGRLPGMGERVDAVVAAIDPEKVARSVDNIDRVAAAVPPEAVTSAVTNIADLSQTLSARREDIDGLVTRMSAISADVSGFTARLPGMGERVDQVLAAVDAAKVGESVDNVHQFATALGNSSGDVEAIVTEVRAAAARFNGLSERAESLLANLDQMAGEGTEGLFAEVRQTLEAIRATADNFSTQAESISGGINQFTERGLRELQAFVGQGRRAASRLERVINNLERDPGQFLLGGDSVPEYSGRRR